MNNLTIEQFNKLGAQLQKIVSYHYAPNTVNLKNFTFVKEIHNDLEEIGSNPKEGIDGHACYILKWDELPKEYFLKVELTSDSYGDNVSLKSLTIVKGKSRQITVFEYE